MLEESRQAARQRYWRRNLQWLGGLLLGWFVVSLGCGVLWVEDLDAVRWPREGFPLGFWIAQQGSVYAFLILIAIYVVVMNRLDRQLAEELKGGDE